MDHSGSNKRRVVSIIWLTLVLAILVLPVVFSHIDMGSLSASVFRSGLAAAGLGASLILVDSYLFSSATGRITRPLFFIIFLLALTIHIGFLALVLFSGRGFGPEVFVHADLVAATVAVLDFWMEFLVIGFLTALAAVGYVFSLREVVSWKKRNLLLWVVPALMVVGVLHKYLPAWELYISWKNWNRASQPAEFDVGIIEPWQRAGILNQLPLNKDAIYASHSGSVRNLVLVYLESINLAILDHPDWPELTPGLYALQEEFGWKQPVYAGGNVTIEGIANSQCGTLVPFFQGNDSLASGYGLAEELPCLADVLGIAGYHQVYIGGARLDFAGKGSFLRAHGFDQVLGWRDWKRKGLERHGAWGLSDVQLFEQATVKLQELHQLNQPFNLTVLTIGTHIPGHSFDGCRPYSNADDRFLDAVHCTDQLVAGWVAEIEEKGLLENTKLILTADHGVFDNSDMRKIFGDMTKDSRIPFIVISDVVPAQFLQSKGSGVDLPATVLDLLEIDTNASFMIGKSMLDSDRQQNYFVSRYMDKGANGEIYFNWPSDCDEEGPILDVSLPLDSCEKRSLLKALKASVGTYSRKRQEVFCDSSQPLAASVSMNESWVEIVVSDLSQVNRFTRKGALVDKGESGIWALSLESSGHIISRRFYSDAEVDLLVDSIRAQTDVFWLLVIDISDTAIQLPYPLEAIESLSFANYKAIALIDGKGRAVEQGTLLDDRQIGFLLNEHQCMRIFSGV